MTGDELHWMIFSLKYVLFGKLVHTIPEINNNKTGIVFQTFSPIRNIGKTNIIISDIFQTG